MCPGQREWLQEGDSCGPCFLGNGQEESSGKACHFPVSISTSASQELVWFLNKKRVSSVWVVAFISIPKLALRVYFWHFPKGL
jgi:hypothetical protein